ncbi:hypothetical protein PoB_005768800 [Plakobranchus ocellatus]|uniref:Uncharacterized protein n=1 Tax=Plakobranchus ocellatus TaxID=259542 RepID=A0AAV4CJC6_9GAST|nr:hypothetical protein PoB_005768800 [Plakobranchus ocellatus]
MLRSQDAQREDTTLCRNLFLCCLSAAPRREKSDLTEDTTLCRSLFLCCLSPVPRREKSDLTEDTTLGRNPFLCCLSPVPRHEKSDLTEDTTNQPSPPLDENVNGNMTYSLVVFFMTCKRNDPTFGKSV